MGKGFVDTVDSPGRNEKGRSWKNFCLVDKRADNEIRGETDRGRPGFSIPYQYNRAVSGVFAAAFFGATPGLAKLPYQLPYQHRVLIEDSPQGNINNRFVRAGKIIGFYGMAMRGQGA